MNPVSILLVEDNEGDIILTQTALSQCRFPSSVSIVKDGQDAISFLRQQGAWSNAPRPDLVLLDINMPRVSGQEVLHFIKSDEDLKAIPVIMFSSSSADRDVRESYSNHANCYITKPLGMDNFEEIVASIEQFWFHTVQLPGRQ